MNPLRPVLLLVLALLAGCGGPPSATPETGPVVLAASSLQEAMEDLADGWQEQGHARPVLSFAGSSALARQVEQGAPAEIFVSADAEWMDYLADKGLLRAGTRRLVAGNALVLVGPPGTAPLDKADLREALGRGRLALADPEAVPAGKYARAALQSLGLWQDLAGRIVPAENVRAALKLVERGEVPFGVVYATDARASAKVAVAWTFAEGSHPPIVYPLAVLAAAKNPQAEGFAAFVASTEGQALLAERGFTAP